MSDIERAYFFGDSLSDTGNVSSLGDFPYESGRFSNDDIWVDYLTDELGIKVDPLLPGATNRDLSDYGDGINFAVGGATSGNDNFNPSLPIGLEQQIDTFELLVENQRDDWDDDDWDDDDWDDDDWDDDDDDEVLEDSVSFLWVGANDYYSFIDDNPDTTDTIEANFPDTKHELKQKVSEVVEDNIGGAVQDLIDLGAEEIVVFNLPDLSLTPLGQSLEPEDRESLRILSDLHNKTLAGTLKGLENSHGDDDDDDDDVNIIQIDVNGLFDSIIENPDEFGFTNVTDNYKGFDFYTEIRQPRSSGDPNDYLFWDSVHPTSAAQKLVADLVIDELTREDLIDD